MNTLYMREFVTVAETLSFSQAAKRIFVSRSALLRHTNSIEDELDVKLFIRTSSGLELTAAGEIVREGFTKMLNEYDQTMTSAKALEDSKGGDLKVGMLYYGVGMRYAYPLLGNFCKRYPEIQVTTISTQPYKIIDSLLSYEIDIGISIFSRFTITPGISTKTIATEPLYAIMLNSHHLAQQKSISLQELSELKLIMMRKQKDLEQHFITLLNYHNLNPERIVYSEHIDTIFMTLEESNGVFIGTHLLETMQHKLSFVPIEAEDISLDIGFLFRKDNENPATMKFIECAQEQKIESSYT